MPLPLGPVAASVSFKAAHAAHAAAHATHFHPYASTFSSFSLGAILAREAWRNTPQWIKDDPALRGLCLPVEEDGKVDSEEMETLSAVIRKMQALASSGSDVTEDGGGGIEGYALNVAVLAYIQLSAQIREQHSRERDALYFRCGPSLIEDQNIENELLGEELMEALNFSIWAYEDATKEELRPKLEKEDFFLIKHKRATKPGYVGYYVAINPERKMVLVGVKGTSTVEDLLTDCCGRAVEDGLSCPDCEDLSAVEVCAEREYIHSAQDGRSVEVNGFYQEISVDGSSGIHIRCHEGILISARRLADDVQPLIEHLSISCGFRVLLCGHSLGGGAAILAGVMLRSRIPHLQNQQGLNSDEEMEKNLRVIAFAPPPVLDYDAALAASPYVLSVVNNSDIVPRTSFANLRVFLQLLALIRKKMVVKEMDPIAGPNSAIAFLRHLSRGSKGEMIMTLEEIVDSVAKAQGKINLRDPKHLYVPGRVLLMFENWCRPAFVSPKDDNTNKTCEHGTSDTQEKAHISGVFADGSVGPLRLLEVDGYKMATDHLTVSYENNLKVLKDWCCRGKK